MVLQSSGLITINDIRTEFLGSNAIEPILFADRLYAVSGNATFGVEGIPASGIIKLSDFYGKQKVLSPTINFLTSTSTSTITYAIKGNRLYSAGQNYGQLGSPGTTSNTNTFTIIPSLTTSPAVITTGSTGGTNTNHIIVLDSTNRLWACGSNVYGQLGTDASSAFFFKEITGRGTLLNKTITSVSVTGQASFALDSTGSLHGWGNPAFGILGFDSGSINIQNTPLLVSSFGDINGKVIKQIATGTHHAVAVDVNGQVYTWGQNLNGQIGNGQIGNGTIGTSQISPLNISNFGTLSNQNIVAVSAGTFQSVALSSSGKVHSWGSSTEGALGVNTIGTRASPTLTSSYGSLSNLNAIVKQISSGENMSIALDTLNRVHVWGWNNNGQQGNNTLTRNITPIEITTFGSLSNVIVSRVQAFSGASMAIDSTGGLHMWGRNALGMLGSGNYVDSLVPILVQSSVQVPV